MCGFSDINFHRHDSTGRRDIGENIFVLQVMARPYRPIATKFITAVMSVCEIPDKNTHEKPSTVWRDTCEKAPWSSSEFLSLNVLSTRALWIL